MDLNFLLRGAFGLAVARALMLAGDARGRGASIATPPLPPRVPAGARADAAPRFGYR